MEETTPKSVSPIISLILFVLSCSAFIAVLVLFEELNTLFVAEVVSTAPELAQAGQPPDLIDYYFGDLPSFVSVPARLGLVAAVFLIAFIFHRMAWLIAGGMLNSQAWGKTVVWYRRRRREVTKTKKDLKRQRTIQHLIASIISFTAFSIFVFVALSQFLEPGALAVIAGLLSAGFGFGARTLIGDLLAGMSNLFEDNFDVDEKVEIAHVTGKVEGVIENVNLRTMSVRAPTGELFVIPNGEIRILRNFSRGRFSTADIKLNIRTVDLSTALPLLQDLGEEATILEPDLLEPWLVISEEGKLGEHTQLTLAIKTRFGHAAQARTRLLALINERLTQADISLAD